MRPFWLKWYCYSCNVWYWRINRKHTLTVNGDLRCDWKPEKGR